MRRPWLCLLAATSALALVANAAFAQESIPPLPPPAPPPVGDEPLAPPPAPPPEPEPPRGGDPYASEPSAYDPAQAPAPAVFEPALVERDAHAPKYALWTGARLSYVGFGFSFYENEQGQAETTGNFLGNGIAPQIDVGARISYRFIPYVYWEHGFMGRGHRFAGTDASASTDFYGVGFRHVSGDLDSVAFATDLSIGRRVVSVSNAGRTYEMSGLEYFRLGLGAEIRLTTLLALSPMLSISSGALNDSEGDLAFACARPGCKDGLTRPTYTNGQVITRARAYAVVSLGVGLHFDVFGK